MPRLTRESNIVVGNKEFMIEELLKTIIYLPALKVKSFFMEIGLTIPRELRIFVLRENLREKVIETRKSRLTLADELNYRLSWFTEFTETQYENLLIFFDDPKLNKDFLEDFWTDLIAYMVDKGVPPKDLKRLVDQSIEYVKKVGLELPDIKSYNREIKDLFFDSHGRIDGLAPSKIRPVLYKSSTLGEIRDLGVKYDVDVPRRLKKTQLAEIIIHELNERGQITDELAQQIRSMSVLIMQRFAIDHDIKASTELKKEEVIEYILANAKETKEAYFVPDSKDVYEQEIDAINDSSVHEDVEKEKNQEELALEKSFEDIEEKAFVEDEIDEVITNVEPQEETYEDKIEHKTFVEESLDLKMLVEEIKKLRIAVEKLNETSQREAVPIVNQEPSTEKPIILNSAEIYGDIKNSKKTIKEVEVFEREAFIESRKEQNTTGTKNDDEKTETKRRSGILGKRVKAFLTKTLKFLFKYTLIIGGILLLLFAVYGIITAFWQPSFLNYFNTLLNRMQIAGKGILQHVHDIINSFRN